MSLKKVKLESTPQSVSHKKSQLYEEHQERLQIFEKDNQIQRQTNHEYKVPYDPPNFRYDYSQHIDYYDFSLINSKFDISLDYCFTQIQRLQISEETVGIHKSSQKNYILEVDQEYLSQRLPPREKDSLETQFAHISSVRDSQTNNMSNMETKQREQQNLKYVLGDNYIEQIYFQGKSENVLQRSIHDYDRDLSEILLDQFKRQSIFPSPQPMLQQQYLQQYEELELISDEELQYVDRINKEEIVQQFLIRKSSFQKQQSSQNSKQSQSINSPIVINNLLSSNSGKQEQSDQKSIHSQQSISSQKQMEQKIFRPALSEKGKQQEQKQQLEIQSQKQISDFQSNMKQSINEIVSQQSEKSIFNDLIIPSTSHSKSMIQNHDSIEKNFQRVSSSEKLIGNLPNQQLRNSTTQSIQFSPNSQINQQQFQNITFAPKTPMNKQQEESQRQSESHLKIQQTPKNDVQIRMLGQFPTVPFNQQLEEFKRQSQSHQQTPRSLQGDPQQLINKSASPQSSSQNIQSRKSDRQLGQFVTVGDKEIYEIEQKLRQNSKFSFENLTIVDFQMDQKQPLRIIKQKQYVQFLFDAKIAHDKMQNQIKESLLGQQLIDKVKADTNEKIFQQKLSYADKKLISHAKVKAKSITKNSESQIENLDSSEVSIIQHIPSVSSSDEQREPTKMDKKLLDAFQEVITRPDTNQGFAGKKKPIKKKAAAKKKKAYPARQPFQQKVTKNKKIYDPEYIVESSGHIQSFVQESSFVVERTHSSSKDQSIYSVNSKKSMREIRPFQDFQTEESNQETFEARRAPPVREIPKFNPGWTRDKLRNISRLTNDYFMTEDWRKVTDIMPKFYPSATEAGGYKVTVIEGLRDFKLVLQFTLYSGQVIGPVICQKRMTLFLGRKPEPYQTDEMLEGLSLHSNIPLNREFCERKESFNVHGKFILANGTRMDIRFQMVYDPAEQINLRKKGRGRQLR